LREIAAASDFDFVAVEPRRASKSAPRRGKDRQKKAGSAPAWLGALWRYRTPAVGGTALVALLATIVVNAAYLQHQRHPAPLFGSTFKIEPPKPPPRPMTIDSLLGDKLPERPLAPVGPAPAAALSPPGAVIAANEAPAAPAPVKKSHDAIGALIADNGVVSAPIMAKSILSAQRALQKLGLPIKPDGAYGVTTRKAVETFQRDNHLPVNGELTSKTRHLLAARSGLPVE
jgi:hypothetical protein